MTHWMCLSNFHSSQGVVFTSISDDIWSVMRKKSFVCMLRFPLRILDRCFQEVGLCSLLAILCTHMYIPDGSPQVW